MGPDRHPVQAQLSARKTMNQPENEVSHASGITPSTCSSYQRSAPCKSSCNPQSAIRNPQSPHGKLRVQAATLIGSPGGFNELWFLIAVLLLTLRIFADESSPVSQEDQKTALAVEALARLQNVDLEQDVRLKQTVLKVLDKTRGTGNFVKLVQQFKLKNQEPGLLEVAARNSTNETGVEAIRLALADKDLSLIEQVLRSTNKDTSIKIAEVLGNSSDKTAVKLLLPLVEDATIDRALRPHSVRSSPRTQTGATDLLPPPKHEK